MSIYVIAQGRIEDQEMLDQYVAKVIPTIEAGGGRVIAFQDSAELIEGETEFPRTVILEFPDREAFEAWYDSPAYQAILPLRLNSTPGTLALVTGLS